MPRHVANATCVKMTTYSQEQPFWQSVLRRFLNLFEKGDRKKQLVKIKFSCTDVYVCNKEHVLNRLSSSKSLKGQFRHASLILGGEIPTPIHRYDKSKRTILEIKEREFFSSYN
jgi:hypothetical protein